MTHFFIDGQIGCLHGGAKVVFAGDGGVQLVRPGEEGDFAVAELDEVIDCRANAGGIVEQNGAGLGSVEPELGQHDGHIVVGQLVEHRLFFAEGEHGYALNLALEHAAHAGGERCGSLLEELTRIS